MESSVVWLDAPRREGCKVKWLDAPRREVW